jgi:putative sterol carrier protein
MKRLPGILPILLVSALMTAGFSTGFSAPVMRTASLIMLIILAAALPAARKLEGVSPIAWAMAAYLGLSAIGFWLWPSGLGRALSLFPLSVLYLLLFLTAALPQLAGKPPFTTFFAKKRTPEAVQATDIFKRINLNMSWVWSAIFAACFLLSLAPSLFPEIAVNRAVPYIFTTALPIALNLGIGLPFTAKYPDHYQRKLGISPVGVQDPIAKESPMSAEQNQPTGPESAKTCRELLSIMPLGFKPQIAGDLKATVQFRVSGDDEFSAYLEIADGKCTHHEGEAAQPDLVIDTPGQVWLDVAQGRMDGQEAFFKGLYKVNGDLTVLMKFKEIFSA